MALIEIIRGDITTLDVDAIVNAANAELAGGGGVDGAIHRAAGPELMRAVRRYPGCPTGSAVMTEGFDLPARFVIHAVGPIWRGGTHGEPELLANTYESAFRLAREEGTIRSIAFPAISAGVYGYPKPDAARIALGAMRAHESEFDRLIAVLFDEPHLEIYQRMLAELPP
ncbi:MAG TPA: O-acetyl-ADP-ribose deacetylase [Gemmatimonadaceae bacterium]|nr:O-acetyl-ADP-ribose deacetylase [Gemmatimonadaceae bacterium]